jgi:archaellum component FlaF (FlaF/FlaG flagellin family)
MIFPRRFLPSPKNLQIYFSIVNLKGHSLLYYSVSGIYPQYSRSSIVGVQATTNFSELDNIGDATIYYDGKLIIEKEDGEEIYAFCDKSIVEQIKGGTQVQIIFDKELDDWKVLKIIE